MNTKDREAERAAGILENLRAGFAYKLVVWAMRLHPPIIGEMVDTVLISAAVRDHLRGEQ